MKRKCEECPADVQAVCRHAFGKYWGDKSTNGEGCDYPMDGVAKAWYAKGWKPDARQTRAGAPVSVSVAGGVVVLARPADAPEGGISPRMPRRPTRPKVSAEIARHASLFFGTKK